jgi:hypothetical protein
MDVELHPDERAMIAHLAGPGMDTSPAGAGTAIAHLL